MEVRFPNGEIDTLRFLGVDTPETFGENDPAEFEGIPENAAGRDHLAKWGERATAFATDELEGQEVRIDTDPEADRRGSYGRLLVYLYTDGTDFNCQLIDRGLARMYDSEFSNAASTRAPRPRLKRRTSDSGTSMARPRPQLRRNPRMIRTGAAEATSRHRRGRQAIPMIARTLIPKTRPSES